MDSKLNHTCQICDEKYYACNSCDKRHTWRSVVDTPECYQIYINITQFRLNITNKKETIEAFANIGLTVDTIDNFKITDIVKSQILDIIKVEDNKLRKTKAKKTN